MAKNVVVQDDFDRAVMQARSRQSSQGPGESRTLFNLLSQGKTVGKSVNVILNSGGATQVDLPQPGNMFEIAGEPDAAMQLCVTLGPLKAIRGADLTAAQLAAIASLQGPFLDFKQMDVSGKPFIWCIPTAILEWGVGGQASRALIDWQNGACINIQANYARLSCQIDAPNGFIGDPGVYNMTAFVGPGNRQGPPATKTFSYSPIVNGGTPDAIPPFAKEVSLVTTSVGTFEIRFWQNRARTINLGHHIFGTAINMQGSYPVPNGAAWFDFSTGVAGAPGSLVFKLGI